MKRFIVSLVLMVASAAGSSFASDVTSSPAILQSFYQTFNGASHVTVSDVNGMTRIGFTLDDEESFAYYNAAGDLVVVTSQIAFSQLPKSLQTDYKKVFDGYFIADVYRFTNDDGTAYFIVLEKDNTRITLKSADKKWKAFKTEERK